MASASLTMVLFRLVLAVGVVVALLLFTARLTRRVGTKTHGTGRATLQVLARQPLSRNASVAIVAAGSRTFIIGVTDAHVTLLGEHPTDAPVSQPTEEAEDAHPINLLGASQASPGSGGGLLDALRQRTVRR